MTLTLLGGARSGKSSPALRRAAASGRPVAFVATGQARDAEMAERIARHRAERDPAWRTVETPGDLVGALSRWRSCATTRSAPTGRRRSSSTF